MSKTPDETPAPVRLHPRARYPQLFDWVSMAVYVLLVFSWALGVYPMGREYAAQDLRDPFSDAWGNQGGGTGLRPDPNRRKEPLEQYPLDGLDMVGTLGAGGGLIGLVMAPDRVTHRIRPGAYLGQSDGRVTAVHEDRIELVELVPDGAGGWLERPAAIALEDQ